MAELGKKAAVGGAVILSAVLAAPTLKAIVAPYGPAQPEPSP